MNNEVVLSLSVEKKEEGVVIKGNQSLICFVNVNNIKVNIT